MRLVRRRAEQARPLRWGVRTFPPVPVSLRAEGALPNVIQVRSESDNTPPESRQTATPLSNTSALISSPDSGVFDAINAGISCVEDALSPAVLDAADGLGMCGRRVRRIFILGWLL
jgi:hypothetical protein